MKSPANHDDWWGSIQTTNVNNIIIIIIIKLINYIFNLKHAAIIFVLGMRKRKIK